MLSFNTPNSEDLVTFWVEGKILVRSIFSFSTMLSIFSNTDIDHFRNILSAANALTLYQTTKF